MAETIQRKRCPKCKTVFEGNLSSTFSCDICGNGYLSNMPPRDTDLEASDARLPRSGAPGNLTHTRDGF